MHYYGADLTPEGPDTLHTPINQAHQDNIIHGHPYHHITHQDLLKQILKRDTEGPDHATLSPDVLLIVLNHHEDIKNHLDTLSQV
jgi:hypothetical protein